MIKHHARVCSKLLALDHTYNMNLQTVQRQAYQRVFNLYACTGERPIKIRFATNLVFRRFLVTQTCEKKRAQSTNRSANPSSSPIEALSSILAAPSNLEKDPNLAISQSSKLSQPNYGTNQRNVVTDELKETLRQVLLKFRAPISFAFAYGSGVFVQSNQSSPSRAKSIHPNPPLAVTKIQVGTPKMIDFIFGVTHTQHWHSINLAQHRDHYSMLGSFGSAAVSRFQDCWGAGLYFNPYVTINGILIKYGVVNLDTLCADLSLWESLYLAGRLQKPVKILRDNPRVRLANQFNLISALRTALLLLPSEFTELELYRTITSISYMGDPRMTLPTENPFKVANIVENNLPNFRHLYSPLIKELPNICFPNFKSTNSDLCLDSQTNHWLAQDMNPEIRGNMIQRLPMNFRSKLYFQYQKKYQIPQQQFEKMYGSFNNENINIIRGRQAGGFERRISHESLDDLRSKIRGVIRSTVSWPSTTQSLKGLFTAGLTKSWIYAREKMSKNRLGKQQNTSN